MLKRAYLVKDKPSDRPQPESYLTRQSSRASSQECLEVKRNTWEMALQHINRPAGAHTLEAPDRKRDTRQMVRDHLESYVSYVNRQPRSPKNPSRLTA